MILVRFRLIFFLAVFAASSIPVASADDLITGFQIRASNPPEDMYTDIDIITFEWETSQVSDAVLTINGNSYTFNSQTSFEQVVGPFPTGTTIVYSLEVTSGNLTDHQTGSIGIESGAPQISVTVVDTFESGVTLVWQDTVKRALSVAVENGGKQGGTASYSYTGDTTLKSWLDKTSGPVSVNGASKETVTFTISVPHTATEKTYSGNIQFQYDSKIKNIPITVTVSQPPAIPEVSDLNLGDVKVGSTYTKSLTITEAGHYKKLTIISVSAKGRLTQVNFPREIDAGGSGTINLKLVLPDEVMTPKAYSDNVVITTNVGTKTAGVKYTIPFPKLSIYSEKSSYDVAIEPGSSSEVSIPLKIRETGGCNHLKNTKLTYKWSSYPGQNPDILNYFDVSLRDDHFSLIKRGDDKTANLHITVQGTAPRGEYAMRISGTASNNDGKTIVEEIKISNIPQSFIDVVRKLDGLKTHNDNQHEIRTKTISLLHTVEQDYNKHTEDVKVACEFGNNAYEFIDVIGSIKYPTSIQESGDAVDVVSTLHTKYTSLTDYSKHFRDKNMIDLDHDTIKNEEMNTVNNIVSSIKRIKPETLCEERSKYQSIKEIYMIVGSKKEADIYDGEIAYVTREINDNLTIAKNYESEALGYAEKFKKTSNIGFMLHHSNSQETYGAAIERYESAKSTYELIGNDCRIDSDRVAGDIRELEGKLDQLETFRSTTILGSIVIFVLLLINAVAVELKRIPEKRIENRCRKLWR